MNYKMFCGPCDFGPQRANRCPVAELYFRDGFCPVSKIDGIKVSMTHGSIYIRGQRISKSDLPGLVKVIDRIKWIANTFPPKSSGKVSLAGRAVN